MSSVLTENYNIDIGGIVGFAQNTIIENVSFAGYINVKTASSVSAGGIAGRYQTPPAIESVMLDRLYSFAEISVTTDKWALLGGIIGGVDLLDGGADVYNDLLGEYAYLKNSLAHITSTSFEGASAAIDENSIASGGEEGLSYDQMRASQNPAVAQMADLMVTYVVKDYNLSVGSYYKGQGTPPHKRVRKRGQPRFDKQLFAAEHIKAVSLAALQADKRHKAPTSLQLKVFDYVIASYDNIEGSKTYVIYRNIYGPAANDILFHVIKGLVCQPII